jgi:hypothetical protein
MPLYRGTRYAVRAGGAAFSILSLAPLAWWKLDEGSGNTAQDSSGLGRHGTLVGSPSWGVGLLNFDGVDDGVVVTGTLGSPSAATLCAWANASDGWLAGTLARINDSVGITTGGASPQGIYFSGAFPSINSGTIAGLHHVAYVCDPANSRQELYVDGVSVASGSSSGAISYATGGSGNTVIGANHNVSSSFFTGMMHDVLFFGSGLTTGQIAQVMAATA